MEKRWVTLNDYPGYTECIELWDGDAPEWNGNDYVACHESTTRIRRHPLQSEIGYKVRRKLFPRIKDHYIHRCIEVTPEEWIDVMAENKVTKLKNTNNPLISKQSMKTNPTTTSPSSSIMQGMVEKMKSQFIPIKETGVKMSLDGSICVQTEDEYVSIDNNGNLQSYPDEMVIDIPVYSISKPTSDVKVGDIIKRKTSFYKVLSVKDGVLRCLTYSGSISNKKSIKDFVLGKSVERVVLNMFDMSSLQGGESGEGGTQGTQFNPMMFLLMNEGGGGELDLKTLMLMQMMGQGGQSGQMNPLMLMMMLGGEKKEGGLMEMMLFSQMMGGKNPFSGMFGAK